MGFGGDEYSDGIRERKRNYQAILLPIFGIILAVLAGAIAFVLAEPVTDWWTNQFDIDAEGQEVILATGFGIWLILIMIFASIFTILAPKPPKGVSEAALDKEKQERERERRAAERRKKQMRAKMRQRLKEQNRK